jgi:hypothetical protein
MVAPGLPSNVTAWSEPSTIADALARSATCAAPTFTGALPNAFVSRTRSRRPGMLVRTIIRMV